MIVQCRNCLRPYDDAVCWTLCPHARFIDEKTARDKDLAFSLMGKSIRFSHDPDGKIGTYTVQSMNYQGMVTLRITGGQVMVGEFSPHLFTVVEEKKGGGGPDGALPGAGH